MPFLLILSAILTALTGVVTGVRPVDVQIARPVQPSDVARVAVSAAPLASGHRHLLGGFDVRARFAVIAAAAVVLTTAPRLYLDRPRA